MSEISTYYYDGQMKRYLVQFMAIFGDMQISVGKNADLSERLVKVPIYGASKDRVVAAIKSENTQNAPVRLPAMSAWMATIDQAPESRKGIGAVRRKTYMPTGGVFPDDIGVVEQRMPVPYKSQFELTIWTSNTSQMQQILEQIMMLFNPSIQIQTSDEPYDWQKLTTVELVDIQPEENIEPGNDRRVSRYVLRFEIPFWIGVPAKVHNDFVSKIYTRVSAVSDATQSSDAFLADLNDTDQVPELVFDLDGATINLGLTIP